MTTPPNIAYGALWLADRAIPLNHVQSIHWAQTGGGGYRIVINVPTLEIGPFLETLQETIEWVEKVMQAIEETSR